MHLVNAIRTGGFILIAALALTACQQRDNTLLAVHASATTRTAPDLAIITLGVVARGATARAAQQAQTERMNAVMEAVRAAGVEDAEVQTVGYGLDPVYAYPRGGAPRITSYQNRNVVAIRVRNLSAISGLIDAAVADGANELQGIQFAFQDEEASLDAARAQAIQTARTRAERYAEAADMRVAGIVSIVEPGASQPPELRRVGDAYLATEHSAANVAPISPGQMDNRTSVTVVFELR
jgi:uncharacterized protein YggE